MPIPEPLYRPSNLTKQQKQDQLAACYGVPMNAGLTHEEIERMRQIVQMHDSERKPVRTIDLNNPPKEPYRYQRFPMMVYGPEGQFALMQSDDDLGEALASGWSEQAPVPSGERDEPLSAALQAEAASVQAQIEAAKSKRHRG